MTMYEHEGHMMENSYDCAWTQQQKEPSVSAMPTSEGNVKALLKNRHVKVSWKHNDDDDHLRVLPMESEVYVESEQS